MKENTRTLILLHTAVFLAGWTGIFGRMISLGGLPLVWYRMIVSVVTLVLVLALTRRLHQVGWNVVTQIAGCGVLMALHWVAFFASIQTANVSVGVACIVSLKSHDPSQRANGMLTIAGGIVITFTKEILTLITG